MLKLLLASRNAGKLREFAELLPEVQFVSWPAEAPELPGVLAYGGTRDEAIRAVQALALRVLADRLEHGEAIPTLGLLFQVAA